jgi:hypothetical protein
MQRKQAGYTGYELLILVFWLAMLVGVGGWVANIVKLVGMNFDPITGLLIVRAVGIFVAPVGAVLGFF